MLKNLDEKMLESQKIYAGNILTLRVDTVLLPNGRKATREVVEHPGAVAVVPITNEGKIVLVRQYRYPVARELLEIPAGKLQVGEDPAACARRELSEETGFLCDQLEPLAQFFTTPGFADEKMYLFCARAMRVAAPHPDADEFINVESYSAQEIRDMMARGELCDAKTLLGISMVVEK